VDLARGTARGTARQASFGGAQCGQEKEDKVELKPRINLEDVANPAKEPLHPLDLTVSPHPKEHAIIKVHDMAHEGTHLIPIKSTKSNCRLRTLLASNNIARVTYNVERSCSTLRLWKRSYLCLRGDMALVTRVSIRHKAARDVALLRMCIESSLAGTTCTRFARIIQYMSLL
jgi:hypothetical protein